LAIHFAIRALGHLTSYYIAPTVRAGDDHA
jgi:hypothetical protein